MPWWWRRYWSLSRLYKSCSISYSVYISYASILKYLTVGINILSIICSGTFNKNLGGWLSIKKYFLDDVSSNFVFTEARKESVKNSNRSTHYMYIRQCKIYFLYQASSVKHHIYLISNWLIHWLATDQFNMACDWHIWHAVYIAVFGVSKGYRGSDVLYSYLSFKTINNCNCIFCQYFTETSSFQPDLLWEQRDNFLCWRYS